MRLLILLIAFLSISASCKQSAAVVKNQTKVRKVDKMDFNHNATVSLTDMVDKATAANKLVFIDIYADWCTPCKLMDEDVFSDKEMSDYMKANFVNYKVDGEKHNGPNLGVMFNVAGFPTLLILDQNGRLLERHDGALYQSGLKAMAERAINRVKI